MVSDALFRSLIGKLIDVLIASRDQYAWADLPNDGATANATWEDNIFKAPFNCKVKEVVIIPNGDIGQATNYMTLDVQNKGADGTGTTSTGSRAVNSSNVIEGFVGVDLVTTDAEVTEGHCLSLKKTVTASGQAFPGGQARIKYEKVP